jgi:hypothetical protein
MGTSEKRAEGQRSLGRGRRPGMAGQTCRCESSEWWLVVRTATQVIMCVLNATIFVLTNIDMYQRNYWYYCVVNKVDNSGRSLN